jgi:predicted subunit of tRNA(5-methylaminomethyl-2-thiouridylate) methyltransferase
MRLFIHIESNPMSAGPMITVPQLFLKLLDANDTYFTMNNNIVLKAWLIVLTIGLSVNCYAQKNCDAILGSDQYYAASATGATENEARMNALSALVENISSVVSSTTTLITNEDRQTFHNISKVTSVLYLNGVSYQICNKSKKDFITVVASISKKDLAESSADVAARVRQYLELMEQKEATKQDFLPEAYLAYLHTFLSPYAIEYHSGSRSVSNVRDYLESYFRTYLANINVLCTEVRENPDYPDQQLTLSLTLAGPNDTGMKFQIDLPEYGALGEFDRADTHMDIIMTPTGKRMRFAGTLTLTPPVDAELKEISDRVHIRRDISFDADFSNVVTLDFTMLQRGNQYLLTPVIRHLTVRRYEWLSEGNLVSTEQMPRVTTTMKEITLRINGSDDLMITEPLVGNSLALSESLFSKSLNIEQLQTAGNLSREAAEMSVNAGFPNDAVVFVKSKVLSLTFRSSMSAIDRQSYNGFAGRYELLIKPVKQILFVESGGIQKSMGIVSPQPKDAISFAVNPMSESHLDNKLGYQNNDGLSYLRGARDRQYYNETETDPREVEAAKKAADYRRQKLNLQAKATVYYTTGALFLGMGAFYHWIDNMIYEKPNEGTLAKFGNVSYAIGGAGIAAGVIYSLKLSHLKKRWSIEPAQNAQGAGIAYRLP